MDGKKGAHQKLDRLARAGILSDKRILTMGEALGLKSADVEDLFEPSEYLSFVNAAFSVAISESDLVGSDPIVRQVSRAMDVDRFDHGKPADHFLRSRATRSSPVYQRKH